MILRSECQDEAEFRNGVAAFGVSNAAHHQSADAVVLQNADCAAVARESSDANAFRRMVNRHRGLHFGVHIAVSQFDIDGCAREGRRTPKQGLAAVFVAQSHRACIGIRTERRLRFAQGTDLFEVVKTGELPHKNRSDALLTMDANPLPGRVLGSNGT